MLSAIYFNGDNPELEVNRGSSLVELNIEIEMLKQNDEESKTKSWKIFQLVSFKGSRPKRLSKSEEYRWIVRPLNRPLLVLVSIHQKDPHKDA